MPFRPSLRPVVIRRILVTLTCAVVLAGALTASAQTYSVLYTFDTNPGDIYEPASPGAIVQGRDGNLHGVAVNGGSGNGGAYKLTTGGIETTIVDFTSLQAAANSGLTLATDGNFYGSSATGGSNGLGSIYQVSAAGVLTTLYSFAGPSDGALPVGPLIQASDGALYGVTQGETGFYPSTLFKITTAGVLTTLHTFNAATEGTPAAGAGLIQGSDGNLYGCNTGGSSGFGTIFKSTTAGAVTVLHNLQNSDGSTPQYSLLQGTDGLLYGTTVNGGANGAGAVFKVTTSGTLTVLHNFNYTTDGNPPGSSLVQATDGNFYGMAHGAGAFNAGTIYEITSGGAYTVVSNLDTSGVWPATPLLQHTNGVLYGGTFYTTGISAGVGVIYSFNIGAAAFAKLITTSGTVGSTLEILGQTFKKATSVSFAGVTTSTFTVNSSGTYMTVTVPTGAKTGTVTVTETTGSLASGQSFNVLPTISSFTPSSGPVGTVVTVNGTGLTQTSKVTFGGVKATTFSVVSDSQLTVMVPTGAKTGVI
jgi:uncharacterized repeat protein (TIGR03803 family)